MSDRKRLLPDLRVIDLRAELEKRSLDKSGVRGVLIQRLSKYLEEEGHDPATYRFGLSDSENKSTPTKRTRRSESVVEPEKEETPAMEDMIVQDDAGDEEETESGNDASQSAEPEQGAANGDGSMDVDANDKANRKRDIKDESEEVPAKKPCLDKEDDHKTENNTDADDSINLDLGDDELLNEETDSTSKLKKDDAGNDDAAETAGDDSAADSAAAATDAVPADDQANAEAPATSTDDGDNAENNSKDKSSGDKKDKKDDGKEGGARNLWVSGLSGDTRAKDLKQLCSKHGKVIGAKVVTNARTPGSRCYGYVTMASSQDAENCIKNLHRTELHGRMISVEKAKSESESAARRQPQRPERRGSKDNKEEGKDTEKTDDNEKGKDDGEKRSVSRSREKSHRSDKDRGRRSTKSRDKKSPLRVLSFSKIWKERDIARQRERSRAAREDERRRRAAEEALRERERRQRQEKQRLQLEREKLRAEREKIEREKNELLRLERERHRLEREKLELERLELKRAQLRLEEERRKRGYEASTYRKAASPPQPAYERDTRHKRAPPPPMVSATHYQYKPALNTNNKSSNRGQFEAPPPPRFEMSSYDRGADKRERDRGDYKRDYRHVSSSNIKYPSNGNINDDARQPLPPGTRPKEPSRSYESRDTRSYRPSPPGKPEPRSWNASTRYPDTTTAAKGTSGGGNEAWSSSEPRYGGGGGAAYEARYPPAYTPAATTTAYPDRYAPARDYRKY